jgi:hypothetical protein
MIGDLPWQVKDPVQRKKRGRVIHFHPANDGEHPGANGGGDIISGLWLAYPNSWT